MLVWRVSIFLVWVCGGWLAGPLMIALAREEPRHQGESSGNTHWKVAVAGYFILLVALLTCCFAPYDHSLWTVIGMVVVSSGYCVLCGYLVKMFEDDILSIGFFG